MKLFIHLLFQFIGGGIKKWMIRQVEKDRGECRFRNCIIPIRLVFAVFGQSSS